MQKCWAEIVSQSAEWLLPTQEVGSSNSVIGELKGSIAKLNLHTALWLAVPSSKLAIFNQSECNMLI